MNYQAIYTAIVDRAQAEQRVKGCGVYYETHHILPKCLGGSNNSSNLVNLTSREHFVCHLLLCAIYPHNKKLGYALWSMCNQQNRKQTRYTPSSRQYAYARCLRHKLPHPLESEKWRQSVVGNKQRAKKISDALKGRTSSIKGVKLSPRHKQNISEALLGKTKSASAVKNSVEAKQASREQQKERDAQLYEYRHLIRHMTVDVMKEIITRFNNGETLSKLKNFYGKSYPTLRKILKLELYLYNK
jgi:hypothetical protein